MSVWPHSLRFAVLIAAAASCGQPDDLGAFMEKVETRPGHAAEALPKIQEPEGFSYEVAGRRSPFAPLGPGSEDARRAGAPPGPDLEREREFLEHYSLDALRMVGSLRAGSVQYGLVRTPDGRVHRLAAGDYIGLNHGRVEGISAREIQLIELIPDGNGGYLRRPAAVSLAN